MPNEDWGVTDPEAQYYYNSVTGEVEQGKQSNSLDRIGPFSTRAVSGTCAGNRERTC